MTKNAIQALEEKRFFKLVCGASLNDTKMIENLSFIFTLAGANVIDLAPRADVILAARKGIEKARSYKPQTISPVVMASIQLDKDPHFRKVEVNYDLCDLCNACTKICPTEAFKIENKKFIYTNERCYGCGICPSYCHVNALSMIDTKPTPKETLSEMVLLGIKSIEFHFGTGYKKLKELWCEFRDLTKEFELLSFSIGSDLLNDTEIKEAARLCHKLAGNHVILQCDGTPMSGSFDKKAKSGNNKDNSSLHVARVIQEENLPVYLQISGGTNQDSYSRAVKSGININGVAIGSYARKLLMPYLLGLDIEENLQKALITAKSLVESTSKTYLPV